MGSRGIKRNKRNEDVVAPTRRKSSRLAGKEADNIYVEREGANGRVETGGDAADAIKNEEEEQEERFYGNRINDGSDLSVVEAASFPKAKWLSDTAIDDAVTLIKDIIPNCNTKLKEELE